MNKFSKLLSTILVVFITVLGLAGCQEKYNFYEDWYEHGATNLTEDHIFEVLTLDEVDAKIKAKESFTVFLGNSSLSTDVAGINAIAYDAMNVNYDGKVYFLNLADFTKTQDKKDLNSKLGINYDKAGNGLIVACYNKDGIVYETTRPDKYEICRLFDTTGATDGTPTIDIHAVAAYTFENYPVKK